MSAPLQHGDGLPPLPKMGYEARGTGMGPNDVYYTPVAYTTEQMQDYARAAIAASQPVGEATWGVLTIGNEGAFYDPKGTRRAFTYARQPGNILASTLGSAVISAANASAGDNIDRGLALLKSLQERGFGVFQIGECAGPPAQAVDLRQFRPIVQKERTRLASSVDKMRWQLSQGLRPEVREKIKAMFDEETLALQQADDLLSQIDDRRAGDGNRS